MQTLRILIGRHYGFETNHGTSMIIDNLLPILKTKFRVKLIWFTYMPEKISFLGSEEPDVEVIDIHDFNNAVEVFKKAKPNIVFDNEFPSLIDLALDVAAKHNHVPVVTRIISTDTEEISKKQLITSFLPMFFQSSMPYDEGQKKKFLRRGRFFIYKYLFYLKTLKATGMNIFKIIEYFLITLNLHISYKIPLIDKRFANSLHFLENESLLERMIQEGFSPSSIVITGNPIFDKIFKRYSHYSPIKENIEKIRILFAPIQLYEGGIWTKKQRDYTVKEIVKSISKNKNKFSMIIKLHPSSQKYSEYKSLVHCIDPTIPIYQKGSIEDFLDKVDVVISYGTVYSSLLFSLIAHKPLILCNFVNFKLDTPIEKGVAWECKQPSEIEKTIQLAISSYPQNISKIDDYLRKILYNTDGCASARLCEEIINLVKKDKEII